VPVHVIKDSPDEFLARTAQARSHQGKQRPFYVCDLGDIVRKHQAWKTLLPRVEPFYAVKCNDDPVVLGLLAKLGTGFDCASKKGTETISTMTSGINIYSELLISLIRIVDINNCE
jgi:diaminopimelate decarboxylase